MLCSSMEGLVKRMNIIGSIFDYILLTVCIEVLSKYFCGASSSTVPRSLVALTGARAELKCSADENQAVIWGFTSYNTSKDTDLYFGDNISLPFISRYKIEKKIRGQHNLVIDSVDLDHAGKYQCVTIATGSKTFAHLNVLDSSPECYANTTNADKKLMGNAHLLMKCRVVYAGNMLPIFAWTKEDTQEALATDSTTSGTHTVLRTTISSVIRQLHSDDNGVTFKCMITFQLPHNSQGNDPDYEYRWNYDLYRPGNLSITRFEDRLECSADGSPTPTYRWRSFETNRSVEGAVLRFDSALSLDNERNFECTAANALGKQTKTILLLNNESDETFTALNTESNEESASLSTAGMVLTIQAISVAVLFLLILGIGFKKFSKAFNTDERFCRSDSLTREASMQRLPISQELQIELHALAENENQETQTTFTNVDASTNRQFEVFRRSDSLGRASAHETQSYQELQSELPTEELNSSVPDDTENEDSHTITGNAEGYCVLTARRTTAQEPQPYCELRLNDQPSDVHINQHTEDTSRPTPMPAEAENRDSQTTASNIDYCTLADRPPAEQVLESKLYSKLRLNDQSSDVYINQHTEDLSTPMPADEAENQDSQTTATGADYSTLTGRTSTEHEPKLYSKLRLNDQPISDYINQLK